MRAGLLTMFLLAVAPAAADGPAGWREGTGVTGNATVLRAVSRSVALAGANGNVLRTADGGATWTSVTPPDSAGLRDLASAGGDSILALDVAGGVQRSGDAGITWTQIAAPRANPGAPLVRAVGELGGGRMLLITRRRLQLSTDLGKTFAAVTPKLTRTDFLRDFDSAGSAAVVSGPRTLLVSGDGRAWKHMRLPPLGHGDDVLLSVDFTGPRTGFVLTAFHRLFRTRDAGHHWTELLGNAGAGISLAMSDGRNGWIAAPGFGNRYDGAVLATSDGGATWRPQIVAPRFVSKVAAAGGTGYLVGNEGTALFATSDGGDAGTEVGVGFRPSPRAVRRGRFVTIRGRVTPGEPGRTVAVSMRSARRWIVRSATTGSSGVFQVRFKLARSAVFVAQVPSDATHRGAGTRPVLVRVTR